MLTESAPREPNIRVGCCKPIETHSPCLPISEKISDVSPEEILFSPGRRKLSAGCWFLVRSPVLPDSPPLIKLLVTDEIHASSSGFDLAVKRNQEVCGEFEKFSRMDEVPNEILLRVFGFLERISQFRLRRTCQRWDELLRSPRVLAVAKLDVGVLMGLKSFRDGSEDYTSSRVEHVILVADTPGKLFAEGSKSADRFLWRYGWFLRCQAANAHALILDGLVIPYSMLAGIIYLDFRAGLKLVVRNVNLMKVSCGLHSHVTFRSGDQECGCLDFAKVVDCRGYFPEPPRYDPSFRDGLNGCLLHRVLASFLSSEPGWEWTKHSNCVCRYEPRKRSTRRVGETMKICVKMLTGKTLRMPVYPSARIEDVKERICDFEGIIPDQQRLTFAGKHDFAYRDSFSQNGVRENAVIHLVLRLRVGHHPSTFLTMYIRVSDHKTVAVTFPKFTNCYGSEEIKKEIEEVYGFRMRQQRLRYMPRDWYNPMELGDNQRICSVPRGAVVTVEFDEI